MDTEDSVTKGNTPGRRHLHTRSVTCDGFLRNDGLWEVEAWLRDVKPFNQPASRFRGELKPGDPVHDIGLRLAIDDGMTIHEAEAMMRGTPYPTCIDVEAIFGRMVGIRVGPGWREAARSRIGKIETCTHLMELLGPAITTLYQTMSQGKQPENGDPLRDQQAAGKRPFFLGGCYSWRTDGPVVAAMFPEFATKPAETD
jgi:hypothetical protein